MRSRSKVRAHCPLRHPGEKPGSISPHRDSCKVDPGFRGCEKIDHCLNVAGRCRDRLIHRQAQDDVNFVGRCPKSPSLMLSLSKHAKRVCSRPGAPATDYFTTSKAGMTTRELAGC